MKPSLGKRLAVAAAVVGIAALVASRFDAFTVRSPEQLTGRQRVAIENLARIRDAAVQFHAERGRFPESVHELLVARGTEDAAVSLGPHEPKDPWRNHYVYVATGDGVLIKCLGSDGQDGGEGEAADLVVGARAPSGSRPTTVHDGGEPTR